MKKVKTVVGHSHLLWQYLFNKNHLVTKITKNVSSKFFLWNFKCISYLNNFDYQSHQIYMTYDHQFFTEVRVHYMPLQKKQVTTLYIKIKFLTSNKDNQSSINIAS